MIKSIYTIVNVSDEKTDNLKRWRQCLQFNSANLTILFYFPQIA